MYVWRHLKFNRFVILSQQLCENISNQVHKTGSLYLFGGFPEISDEHPRPFILLRIVMKIFYVNYFVIQGPYGDQP